jgi:hypothetical protein
MTHLCWETPWNRIDLRPVPSQWRLASPTGIVVGMTRSTPQADLPVAGFTDKDDILASTLEWSWEIECAQP